MSLHIICCRVTGTRDIFAHAKAQEEHISGGAWIFWNISRDLMKRAKIAAAVEGTSIKALMLKALDEHLQDLEKKGLLPKGK